MNYIHLHDKKFQPFISEIEITQRVREIAREIGNDWYDKKPLLLSVLNGSFMFAAELLKNLNIPLEISFVKLASYQGTGSTGSVKQLIGLNEQLEGRFVLVVEDIVDTGITMDKLLKDLNAYKPAEVRVATLLFKPDAFIRDFKIHYLGFSIPNNFIVGYGLDYNGLGRNYPDIYTLTK